MDRLLVLVSGLPATGKTTTADGLARRLHTIAVSRDWAREEVVHSLRSRVDLSLDPIYGRLNRGHRPRAQRLANRVLFEVVQRHLVYDHPAVVEVVADPGLREALRRVASGANARFVQIECTCSDRAMWEDRLRSRGGNWMAAVERIERWYTPPTDEVRRLDSSHSGPDDLVDLAYHLCVD